MIIRPFAQADLPRLTDIMNGIVAAGDAFVFELPFTPETLQKYIASYEFTFTAELDGRVAGAYVMKPNQPQRGGHIANGTYWVDPDTRGHGVGRRLGQHSIDEARRRGYRAIQFNAVVSTNTPAVKLWTSLGFRIVGTIPNGFRRGDGGHVDLLMMFLALDR